MRSCSTTRRAFTVTAEAPVARSPLEGIAPLPGLREVPFLTQLDVRFDPGDEAAMTAATEALGQPVPTTPDMIASTDELDVLWLGPDEWLVLAAPGRGPELEERLRGKLSDGAGSVVDVSANRTSIELSGPHARDILEHGCSIDLDPRAFGPGRCAQTDLARSNVILVRRSAHPVYLILVRPSFARYLWTWLADAASEWPAG
jgi:sarcosine oxidase subunit gamma